MPSTGISHRPKTLRQAKNDHRKSGATKRLSESELSALERRVELQERADRIRDREARRKANLKKKEERIQKEREERQSKGIPEPAKKGFHIGPSQLSLGKFMGAGQKMKRDEETSGMADIKGEEGVDMVSKGYQISSIPRTPWRNPLKIIPPYSSALNLLPDGAAKKACPKSSNLNSLATSLRSSPTTTSRPMGPPAKPKLISNSITQRATQEKKLANAPQSKPSDFVIECWDDVFASSTQIARELSPPTVATRPMPPPSLPPSHILSERPTLTNDETNDLLDQLSTQDLDFSGVLTQIAPPAAKEETHDLLAQISTQDLDFSGDLTQLPSTIARDSPASENNDVTILKDSSDFDEDLTEEDMEDIALEFERESTGESTAKSRTTTPNPAAPVARSTPKVEECPQKNQLNHEAKPSPDKISADTKPNHDEYEYDDLIFQDLNCDDNFNEPQYQDIKIEVNEDVDVDFDLSTQDLRELDSNFYECDVISTQDWDILEEEFYGCEMGYSQI